MKTLLFSIATIALSTHAAAAEPGLDESVHRHDGVFVKFEPGFTVAATSTKLADGSTMKVRFTDYAVFVPTAGLDGKTAILEGHATKEVITEAMRRHYAHDAGKSADECEAIKGDKTELTFLADGVLIKH